MFASLVSAASEMMKQGAILSLLSDIVTTFLFLQTRDKRSNGLLFSCRSLHQISGCSLRECNIKTKTDTGALLVFNDSLRAHLVLFD